MGQPLVVIFWLRLFVLEWYYGLELNIPIVIGSSFRWVDLFLSELMLILQLSVRTASCGWLVFTVSSHDDALVIRLLPQMKRLKLFLKVICSLVNTHIAEQRLWLVILLAVQHVEQIFIPVLNYIHLVQTEQVSSLRLLHTFNTVLVVEYHLFIHLVA